MKRIVDIHNHILWGLDDGAQSREDMITMLRAAYEDGTEALCLTPHFEPESFGYTPEELRLRFDEAKAYAAENLKGLTLYLGNELSAREDAVERIRRGDCQSLAGGRYVLVDFFGITEERRMRKVLETLWCAGYIPIVAHVERYAFLWGKLSDISMMARDGVLFQVNMGSLMAAKKSDPARKMAEKLLSRRLVDVIASDAHDTEARTPQLSACYDHVAKKYGAEYAEVLFYINPKHILENKDI